MSGLRRPRRPRRPRRSPNGRALGILALWGALAGLLGTACARPPAGQQRAGAPLRVCADPNNLPFSNARQEGFENHIATLVAHELHRPLAYTWWAQRRGFVSHTLSANRCDLFIGVPAGFGPMLTTRPYYRSTYVFVTRRSGVRVHSLDDPILHHVRVGVQLIGDDMANTPPAHALARRGVIANVTGYSVNADYGRPNPPARIVDAVAHDDVDVALVWGPTAGYFATREPVPLRITPVSPQVDLPFLPFAFDIAMGVRRTDTLLARRLDSVIALRRPQIDSILAAYDVPRVDVPLTVATAAAPRVTAARRVAEP